MKIFFDTEFHEYTKKVVSPDDLLPGIEPEMMEVPTVELISIGMISEILDSETEESREYYAISKEFDVDDAWANDWLRPNVLFPIHMEMIKWELVKHGRSESATNLTVEEYGDAIHLRSFKTLLNYYGKTREEIADGILDYIDDLCEWNTVTEYYDDDPHFYAYFADYDWVVFCQLFGRMIDLPKGFPFWCRDIKQMMEVRGLDTEWKRANCPEPKDSHVAISDARWNRELFWKIVGEDLQDQKKLVANKKSGVFNWDV